MLKPNSLNECESSLTSDVGRRSLKILAITCGSLITLGCATANKDFSIEPLKINDQSEMAMLVKSLSDDGTLPSKCYGYIDSKNENECGQKRNLAITRLIAQSESMCETHLKTIYGNDATANIALGSLTHLFTGAATVVNGVRAKTNLAAMGFLASSERSLVNEVVYKSILVPAIHEKIKSSRKEMRTSIYGSLQSDITKYSAGQSIADVFTFHYSCSFMEGLQRALAEGTNNSNAGKLATLRDRARLLQTDIQINNLIDASNKDADITKSLNERYKAISEAMKHLEISEVSALPSLPKK